MTSEYTSTNIKILSANANSIRTTTKKKKLTDLVAISQAEVILLQETNLQDDQTIELLGYHTVAQENRKLDKKKSGGGVITLARNDIKITEIKIEFPQSEGVQSCSVLIGDVIVTNMYRAPKGQCKFDDEDMKIFECLTKIRRRHLLAGDLNFHIQWKNWTHQAPKSKASLEKMNSSGYIQYIDEATKIKRIGTKKKGKPAARTNGGEEGNILDVFISKNDGTVMNPRTCPELDYNDGLSDHKVIMCEIRTYMPRPKKKTIEIEDLANTKFDDFRNGLSEEDLSPRPEESVSLSNDRIVDAIKRRWKNTVKTKIITFRNNKPVYKLSGELLELKKRVQKITRKFRKSGKPEELRKEATDAQKELKKAISRFVYEKNTQYLEKNCHSSKSVAKFLKKFQEKKNEFGPLRKDNEPKGIEITSETETAEVMVEHFNRIYTPRDDFTNNFTPEGNPPRMKDVVFTEKMITDAIEKLGTTSASSEDGVKSLMLKKCKDVIAKPMKELFQKVYNGTEYPVSWLGATIVPIHKGGVIYDSRRYRPVSLLSTMLKLYETVLNDQCSEFVSNEVLWPERENYKAGWSKFQFAYLEKSSVEGNLLSHNLRIAEASRKNMQLTTIYCDAKAAFDVLSFKNIGKALVNLGLPEKLIRGVIYGLSRRSIKVRIGQTFSRPAFPTSGIAQGSSFSGFLFNAAINSVYDTAPSTICEESGLPYVRILGYADDLKVSYLTHNREGFDLMKNHQTLLQKWANENSYVIHPDKLVAIQNGKSKIEEEIKVGKTVVKIVKSHKDLGVWYTDQPLNFDTAWKTKIASVRCKAIELRQKILTRSVKVLRRLWDTYLYSILIFAVSVIGYPSEDQLKQILKIQRMFFMNSKACGRECDKRRSGQKLCSAHTVPEPFDITLVKRNLISFHKVLKEESKIVEPFKKVNSYELLSNARNTRNAVLTSSNYFKPIVEEKLSGEDSNLFRYRSCGDLLRIPPHTRIDTKTFVKYLNDPECHLNKFNLEPKIGGRKRNVLIGNYKIQTNAGYGWCARKKYRQEMEPSVHGPTLAISRKKRHVT